MVLFLTSDEILWLERVICNPTLKQNMFLMIGMKGNGGRCIFGHSLGFLYFSCDRPAFSCSEMGFFLWGFVVLISFWFFLVAF